MHPETLTRTRIVDVDDVISAHLIPGFSINFDGTQTVAKNALTEQAQQMPIDPLDLPELKVLMSQAKVAPNEARSKVRLNLSAVQLEKINALIEQNKIMTGFVLQEIREVGKISISELASILKIHAQILESIEQETHQTRPAVPYLRGFVSSYLKYFGINSTSIVESFIAHHKKNLG
jgi:DNA-binding transcriptional regulator YiaG